MFFPRNLYWDFLFKKMTKTFIQVCWWILPVPCPRASPKKLLGLCHPMPGGWRWVGDDHGDGDAKAYMVCWEQPMHDAENRDSTMNSARLHAVFINMCTLHTHIIRYTWDDPEILMFKACQPKKQFLISTLKVNSNPCFGKVLAFKTTSRF